LQPFFVDIWLISNWPNESGWRLNFKYHEQTSRITNRLPTSQTLIESVFVAIFSLPDRIPRVDASAYITDSAEVIGSVHLADRTSVWFNAVLRGDNDDIKIGTGTNIQESAVLHTDTGLKVNIGAWVTIGHQAMLHGCQIGDECLIGIQSVILNGAIIGKNCLIGAGTIVTEGKVIPERSLVIGSPGKVVRTLTDDEVAKFRISAEHYTKRAEYYRQNLKRLA
jgi:carbonic anhydrase/acetyltransferase-like protein (isoleucine patch superfamily)